MKEVHQTHAQHKQVLSHCLVTYNTAYGESKNTQNEQHEKDEEK